jgi:hypothetical protein
MELIVTLLTCADPDVNRRRDKQNGWGGGSVTTAVKETGMKEAIKLSEVTSEAKYNNRGTVYINMSNLHVREKGIEHDYEFSY